MHEVILHLQGHVAFLNTIQGMIESKTKRHGLMGTIARFVHKQWTGDTASTNLCQLFVFLTRS